MQNGGVFDAKLVLSIHIRRVVAHFTFVQADISDYDIR